MSPQERLDTARHDLLFTAWRLLELSHRPAIEATDSAVLDAADAVDDACGELLDAIRDERRPGTAEDRA
jgi:hypothetical protein